MKNDLQLILASKSPRRQELLRGMGYDFTVQSKEVEESYPANLPYKEVPIYLAEKKARAFDRDITGGELVITADTIVIHEGKIMGKPADRKEAAGMLQALSDSEHEVITGVCLLQQHRLVSFSDTTLVHFAPLLPGEIDYYLDTCKPYDKAGAYGIQEWIGFNKITRIQGSYTNVVGLPTEKLYRYLSASSSGRI